LSGGSDMSERDPDLEVKEKLEALLKLIADLGSGEAEGTAVSTSDRILSVLREELADIRALREARQVIDLSTIPADWLALEEETRSSILKLARDILSGTAYSEDIDRVSSEYPAQLAWAIEQVSQPQNSSAVKTIQSINPYFTPTRSQIISD
jgi:hypothetical protein